MAKAARPNGSAAPAAGSHEAILAEARAAYVEWARRHLAEIRPRTAEIAGDGHAAARQAIFEVFHDLKGGGGSVGLPLLSDIGASACAYLRGLDGGGERPAKVVEAHVLAAEGVVAAGVEGDGGPAGAALLDKLRRISA